MFPLNSLHSFRFAYFCFNVTPSGYSHFYPGFSNRIPVRLAFRGGGTSLTAHTHTHTNKLWIPPKYTHKYLVCILHPHSPPLLLCVWYFLGYFNHASYEIPTDSSISGSLHVTVAMDNDFFLFLFFTLLDQFFRSIFPWHEITPISRMLQLIQTGWLVSWVEEFCAVKTVFLSCFVWKDNSTQTHAKKTNLSWTTWVTAWCLLEMLSAVYPWLCVWAKRYDVPYTQRTSHTYPARYLVQSSLLPATTTRWIPLSLLTFLRARKVWENKPPRVLEKTGQEKKKLENHHGAASGRFRCWSNFGGPRRKSVTGRRSGRRHETLKKSLCYPAGNVASASNLSDKGSANAT